MLKTKVAYSSFSVNDLAKAKKFYTEILGLRVDKDEMGLKFHFPSGGTVFVYQKDTHQPATFTILNFQVENIDEAVDTLMHQGIHFERYDGMPADEKGIVRGKKQQMGPDIAWFKDPAGNILSVLQE